MKNVLEYLNKSSSKYPDKIAVIYEDEKITYMDFNNRCKSIGTFLCDKSEPCKSIVTFMEKDINSLSSFFGIVYAGCFYTFLNPEFPESRLKEIVGVLNPSIVISDDTNIELAKQYFSEIEVVNINDIKDTPIDEEKLSIVNQNQIDYDPLYVNFTSGSTGVPKGVVISHRSVIDFIDIFTEEFNFKKSDIIANQAPFDFDVSVKDIYSSIKVGATLVIIPRKLFSNPTKLLDYICDNKCTTMTWAVSALCLITTFHGLDYKIPMDVNKVIFSGEVMPLKHLKLWMNALPKAKFINVYGPTEITCNCTYHIIDRKRDYEEYIPIGKSFRNERVLLLDENDKLITEENQVGEICVSGTALALGYFKNKEQTESLFVQNPLIDGYIELIYRTGDLGMYDFNKDLVFKGRKDFQIKFQGHRIELEEIEKNISLIDEVVRCCVLFDEEKSKLYGFYIGNIDKKELRDKLKINLPAYMIPTSLDQMEEFPLNKNGKIDRKALFAIKRSK